ncbi:MAG: hypothetical protein ACP5EP_01395 [Acidobacteriaceae bacterium]
MSNLENTTRDHARPSYDALLPAQHGPSTPERRLEKLANESAERALRRTKLYEWGKGFIVNSDGH